MTYSTRPAKLNIIVGQPLVFLPPTGGYDDRPSFGWHVTKVSPTGKFELTSDTGKDFTTGGPLVRYFNNQGYQVEDNMNGRVMSYGGRVSVDVEGWVRKVADDGRARHAADALNNVKLAQAARGTWGKESLQTRLSELENLMALARAAVEVL